MIYPKYNKSYIYNSLICFCRLDYLEKSKLLQEQLRELRSEIEVLKVGEKQSQLDELHEEQLRLGENKYSTLRKVTLFNEIYRFLCIYIFF